MASTKISDMTAATNVVGATIPIVQSGVNKKADISLFDVAWLQTVTSAATVTPNADADDMVLITAQAEALLLANPSGTPTDGQMIVIRIKDNGTARAISYGANYRAVGVTLPTTTVLSKVLYMPIVWNAQDSKWDVVGVIQQA
jgi:hypothetical protein